MPARPTSREILGSERPLASGAELVAPVDAATPVEFTILLRRRPGGPALPPAEHWQDVPPSDRSYLSVADFAQAYGAADEDLQAVTSFVESSNLQVVEADAGRRRVVVQGPAASVNTAFGITLNQYRAPLTTVPRPLPGSAASPEQRAAAGDQVHRGFDGSVQVPTALADVITAVIGLDNRRRGGPAGDGTGDPPQANSLLPTTIAQLYNFPTTGAAGQTIGVFAGDGAAYLPADITKFISSLPAGHNTQPHLFPIGLRVDGTQFGNDPSKITKGNADPACYEITQDIETSAAIGQGANINVYFTADTEAGWEAFLSRAVFPPAGDHAPAVLTASWVLDLQDDQGTIGDPASNGSLANVLTSRLQEAAARGITVFMAIGDWGAGDQIHDQHCHVPYPNSDPWVTGDRDRHRRRRRLRHHVRRLVRGRGADHQQHRQQPAADLQHHVLVAGLPGALGHFLPAHRQSGCFHQRGDPVPADGPRPVLGGADDPRQCPVRVAHGRRQRHRGVAPPRAGHRRPGRLRAGLRRLVP